MFQGDAYLLIIDGKFSHRTISHIEEIVAEKNLSVNIEDVTDQMGLLSIQGPKRLVDNLIIELI